MDQSINDEPSMINNLCINTLSILNDNFKNIVCYKGIWWPKKDSGGGGGLPSKTQNLVALVIV